MKKLLLLTTCLFGGLMAGDRADTYIAEPNPRAACDMLCEQYEDLATQALKVERDIQGHAKVLECCRDEPAYRAFMHAMNPDYVNVRNEKILRLTLDLSNLDRKKTALLKTIVSHENFPNITFGRGSDGIPHQPHLLKAIQEWLQMISSQQLDGKQK